MCKFEGYDSFIATYVNGDYPNLKYTPGLRIEEVNRTSGHWLRDSCAWLRKNAKRIDVLNLYHFADRSLAQALTYKFFNPSGKIYLKCDGWPMPYRRTIILHPTSYILTKICDCISTELKENSILMSKSWHRKIVFVPNPVNPDEITDDFRPFSERSNIIFTVGRLGTKQKATEILLEAFAKIAPQIPDWTLKLAGRIDDNVNIASDFYAAHPALRDRIIFTGEIRDRETLMNMYNEAKIFAFPSRWEGCSIALAEALVNGLLTVTSNIIPNELMTQHFKYALGSEVDDVDGLAKNLLYACTHETESEALAREGMEATRKRCDMKRVCDVIAEWLNV